MAKTPRRMLTQAADLMALAEISAGDLVCASVYGSQMTMIQLRPKALVRVFELLRVPRRKVEICVSERGNLHVSFDARGAHWTCVVRPDSPEGQRFRPTIEAHAAKALPGREQLCLPAPAEVGHG
jgi:hypothetical protein